MPGHRTFEVENDVGNVVEKSNSRRIDMRCSLVNIKPNPCASRFRGWNKISSRDASATMNLEKLTLPSWCILVKNANPMSQRL
jgi:hypothetical protein